MKLREYIPGKSQPPHQIEDESKYKHGSVYKMDPRKIVSAAKGSITPPTAPNEFAGWTNNFHPIKALPGLPKHLAPAIVLAHSTNRIASKITSNLRDLDRFGDSFKGKPEEAFNAVMDLYKHFEKVFSPYGTVQIGRRDDGLPYFQIRIGDLEKAAQTLLNPHEIFYGRSMGSSMEVPLVKLSDMGLHNNSGLFYENKNLQENKVRKLIRKVLKEEILKENQQIWKAAEQFVKAKGERDIDYEMLNRSLQKWKVYVDMGYDLSTLYKDTGSSEEPEGPRYGKHAWLRDGIYDRRRLGDDYYREDLYTMIQNKPNMVHAALNKLGIKGPVEYGGNKKSIGGMYIIPREVYNTLKTDFKFKTYDADGKPAYVTNFRSLASAAPKANRDLAFNYMEIVGYTDNHVYQGDIQHYTETVYNLLLKGTVK